MEQLIDSYKKLKHLHHAYFLVGEAERVFQELESFLSNEVNVVVASNPDFWHSKLPTLTIDEAREIAEASERKHFSLGKKIFIIETDFITEEAQNSLLKVFEEPTADTHFFIISPQDIMLPTLRSRMQVYFLSSIGGTNTNKEAVVASESVLSLTFKERLEKVKEVTDAIKDEEKTKQDAIDLLNQIEKELYDQGLLKSSDSLRICELARTSLYDRGAPVKIILENVMLNI